MLSLFYIIKFAQNGGCQLHCIFCTSWLCYAELFERFPAFPGWFQLLLQFLPQDHVVLLCLRWSLVHQTLHLPAEKEIHRSQVRGARGPGYWASAFNPSVAKRFLQILTDDISEVRRGAIMLEPHFTTDFQRHHCQQEKCSVNVTSKRQR
jgi:hypothetical protein